MNLFFDTSALIKFFHEEPGTSETIYRSLSEVHLAEVFL